MSVLIRCFTNDFSRFSYCLYILSSKYFIAYYGFLLEYEKNPLRLKKLGKGKRRINFPSVFILTHFPCYHCFRGGCKNVNEFSFEKKIVVNCTIHNTILSNPNTDSCSYYFENEAMIYSLVDQLLESLYYHVLWSDLFLLSAF